MAYFILIAPNNFPEENFILDKYIGSAFLVNLYWESVGIKLSLPIISKITEEADSENGFTCEGNKLLEFKDELDVLYDYWKSIDECENEEKITVGDNFFSDIEEIKNGIDEAFSKELKLVIG